MTDIFDPSRADAALGGQTATAPSISVFDPGLADRAMSADLRSMVVDSARQAVQASPDTMARASALSRKSGLPVGAVMADLPEFEARDIAGVSTRRRRTCEPSWPIRSTPPSPRTIWPP